MAFSIVNEGFSALMLCIEMVAKMSEEKFVFWKLLKTGIKSQGICCQYKIISAVCISGIIRIKKTKRGEL
jgi:hypothetical protein